MKTKRSPIENINSDENNDYSTVSIGEDLLLLVSMTHYKIRFLKQCLGRLNNIKTLHIFGSVRIRKFLGRGGGYGRLGFECSGQKINIKLFSRYFGIS